jgi:hypothetical protein
MVQDQQFAIASLPLHQECQCFKNSKAMLNSHAIPCLLIFLPMRHHYPPWGAPWEDLASLGP